LLILLLLSLFFFLLALNELLVVSGAIPDLASESDC